MIKDLDYYKDEIHCLYSEKKDLQTRIDKAIEYIKQHYYEPETDLELLLDILKGSDSND